MESIFITGNIRSGTIVILDNKYYEVLKVDFGCLCTLRQLYDEGEVIIIERGISEVKQAIFKALERGVKE